METQTIIQILVVLVFLFLAYKGYKLATRKATTTGTGPGNRTGRGSSVEEVDENNNDSSGQPTKMKKKF